MLRYNEKNNSFLLYTHDTSAAEAAGLTLSINVRGPNGEKLYFTSDYDKKPTFNPYAVLEFIDQAQERSTPLLSEKCHDPLLQISSWPGESSRRRQPNLLAKIGIECTRNHGPNDFPDRAQVVVRREQCKVDQSLRDGLLAIKDSLNRTDLYSGKGRTI